MRLLMVLAAAVLALPTAIACTAPPGPTLTILVGVESGPDLVWEQDSSLRHQGNGCTGHFRGHPAFDGGSVVWADYTDRRLFIADADDGSTHTVDLPVDRHGRAHAWSFGDATLLTLDARTDTTDGRVSVRRVVEEDATSTLTPPTGSSFVLLHRAQALATTQGDPPVIHIYDAGNESWILRDQSLGVAGWPAGSHELHAFNERWVVGETVNDDASGWWAFDVANGTLHVSQSLGGPTPSPGYGASNGASATDLRGDVLYVARSSMPGAAWTLQEWSVTLPTFEEVGQGPPPPLTLGGLTARFRPVEPSSSTQEPTPGEGTADTSSRSDVAQGDREPAPVPMLSLIACIVAVAALVWRCTPRT